MDEVKGPSLNGNTFTIYFDEPWDPWYRHVEELAKIGDLNNVDEPQARIPSLCNKSEAPYGAPIYNKVQLL